MSTMGPLMQFAGMSPDEPLPAMDLAGVLSNASRLGAAARSGEMGMGGGGGDIGGVGAGGGLLTSLTAGAELPDLSQFQIPGMGGGGGGGGGFGQQQPTQSFGPLMGGFEPGQVPADAMMPVHQAKDPNNTTEMMRERIGRYLSALDPNEQIRVVELMRNHRQQFEQTKQGRKVKSLIDDWGLQNSKSLANKKDKLAFDWYAATAEYDPKAAMTGVMQLQAAMQQRETDQLLRDQIARPQDGGAPNPADVQFLAGMQGNDLQDIGRKQWERRQGAGSGLQLREQLQSYIDQRGPKITGPDMQVLESIATIAEHSPSAAQSAFMKIIQSHEEEDQKESLVGALSQGDPERAKQLMLLPYDDVKTLHVARMGIDAGVRRDPTKIGPTALSEEEMQQAITNQMSLHPEWSEDRARAYVTERAAKRAGVVPPSSDAAERRAQVSREKQSIEKLKGRVKIFETTYKELNNGQATPPSREDKRLANQDNPDASVLKWDETDKADWEDARERVEAWQKYERAKGALDAALEGMEVAPAPSARPPASTSSRPGPRSSSAQPTSIEPTEDEALAALTALGANASDDDVRAWVAKNRK